MDYEKLKKEAQEKLDRKLAEVDRLTLVAKELEKKNVDAQIEHDKLIESLTGDINGLRAEKAFTKDEIEKVKTVLKERQNEDNDLRRAINVLAVESETTANLIEEKKRELAVVEQAGEKTIKQIEGEIAVRKTEIEALKSEFTNTDNELKVELRAVRTEILRAQSELTRLIAEAETHKTNLVAIKEEAKTVLHEAEKADQKVIITTKEIGDKERQLNALTEEIEAKKVALEALEKETETVNAELGPLLAKRIDSINYMKELEHKETNLRKRYEDVGLEYN